MVSPGGPVGGDFDFVDIEEALSTPAHTTPGNLATPVILDSDGRNARSFNSSARAGRSKFEMEQLLSSPGSLPKPMPRDKREAVIREMMPTATFEMLAKVPAKLLDVPTEEAQALRRKFVKGSTIVFLSAGLQGKRFILEQAASLGVKSVVLDHPDSWSRSLVDEGVIAKFLPVDMTQTSVEVFEDALAQIKNLGSDGKTGTVDGITTFVELSVPLVARLAEALALPGMRPEAVDNARDKYVTRGCLAKAGLPTPRNFLITSRDQLKAAADQVKFPAVLKPVSGAASLGVKKVASFQEMQQAYEEIVSELSSLVVSSGALIKNDGSGQGVDAGCVIVLDMLMEQYLDGCEVDIDVVMSDGDWRYAAVQDNGPTLEPYFNETWAASPSLIEKEKQRELKELAVASVKALGFSCGVFHVECKYTSTGPQLIEVNARMGGGQVRECNLLTWGVDLVEETLFICLGIPARPVVAKLPKQGVAYCYSNAMKSGTLKSNQCILDLASKDGVVWAKPLVRSGDKVVGPADGLPTWVADLCVTKPTAKEALEYLLKLEKELPLDIQ
jgi:carnosine synthase